MNKADFLYHYAKEYFRFNVKATLMLENWTDRDCNSKYHQFMRDYINLNLLFITNNTSDDKIKASLNFVKEVRLNHAYDFLFNDMKQRLVSKKGTISPQKEEELKSKIKPYRTMNKTDFEYIQELRKIEEVEY